MPNGYYPGEEYGAPKPPVEGFEPWMTAMLGIPGQMYAASQYLPQFFQQPTTEVTGGATLNYEALAKFDIVPGDSHEVMRDKIAAYVKLQQATDSGAPGTEPGGSIEVVSEGGWDFVVYYKDGKETGREQLGRTETVAGETAMTEWQQAQMDLARQQFEWEQQQAGVPGAPEAMSEYQRGQLGLGQQQLAQEQQNYLAQMATQPKSWLEAAAASGQPPVVQPWMMPLMPQQYPELAGLQAGQPVPGWPEQFTGAGALGGQQPWGTQPTGVGTQPTAGYGGTAGTGGGAMPTPMAGATTQYPSYMRPAYEPGGAAAPGQGQPAMPSSQFYDPTQLDWRARNHTPNWYKEQGMTELATDMFRANQDLVWAVKAATGAERERLEQELHTMRIRQREMEIAEYQQAASERYANPQGSPAYQAYMANKVPYLEGLKEQWGAETAPLLGATTTPTAPTTLRAPAPTGAPVGMEELERNLPTYSPAGTPAPTPSYKSTPLIPGEELGGDVKAYIPGMSWHNIDPKGIEPNNTDSTWLHRMRQLRTSQTEGGQGATQSLSSPSQEYNPAQYAAGSWAGYNPNLPMGQMPALTRPSRQYQARMGPTALDQYTAYVQARTGMSPEEMQFRLWSMAPPGGGYSGLRWTR